MAYGYVKGPYYQSEMVSQQTVVTSPAADFVADNGNYYINQTTIDSILIKNYAYVMNFGTISAGTVKNTGTLYCDAISGTADHITVENGGWIAMVIDPVHTDNNAGFRISASSAEDPAETLDFSYAGAQAVSSLLIPAYAGLSVTGNKDFSVTDVSIKGRLEADGISAENIAVLSGGGLLVRNGATVRNLTVANGGEVFVRNKSAESAAGIVFTGNLRLGGSLHMHSYDAAVPNSTAAVDGTLIFDLTDRTPAGDVMVDALNLLDCSSFAVSVSSSQSAGVHALALGADGFDKTITVTDAKTDTALGTLEVGGKLDTGCFTCSLQLDSGTLTMTLTMNDTDTMSLPGDLNADGRADIVMTITEEGHGAEGATGAWLIQEDQTAAWGDLSTRDSDWEIFGTGKTAAGKKTDDVYIRSTSNIIGAWTTGDDGKVNGWETIGEFDSDTQIIGLGDFNADGQTDLLLRNVNGAVGCFFTGGPTTGWNYFQSLGDEWKLTAVGDLNGDGRDDVVLKHDAGFAGSWLTQEDGTMAWADLDTLPDGFEIVGAGDFNADGTDDVLLKSGNYYGAWLVNNGNAAGWMGLGDLGDVTVEQIADFNGDGKDDLRIRTAAGDLGTQLVMGEDNLVWKYYGSVGSEWSTSLAALA